MGFCTNCGKELVEGEICECQVNFAENLQAENVNVSESGEQQAENAVHREQQSFAATREPSAVFAHNIFKLLLNILKAPVSAGRRAVEEGNVVVGISYIVLQGIITGLFGMAMVSKLNELIEQVGRSIVDAYGYDYTLIINYISMGKFPLGKGFMISLFGSIMLSLIIAVLVMLLLTVFGGRPQFSNAIVAAGVRCVGTMPLSVLALLVSFIDLKWSIIVFLVSGIMGILFMAKTVTAGSGLREDRTPYLMLSLVLLILIVQVIMATNMETWYLSDLAHEAYDEFIINYENMEFSDIVKRLIRKIIDVM